jgi:hypothetical protein
MCALILDRQIELGSSLASRPSTASHAAAAMAFQLAIEHANLFKQVGSVYFAASLGFGATFSGFGKLFVTDLSAAIEA